MKLTHLLAAAALALTGTTATAYPYESEFKARGAYAPDHRHHGGRGRRDGRGRHDGRGYGDHGYGDRGYGDGRHGRRCWTGYRHHRSYRVCR